jgi:hypothetical protein
MLIRSIEPVRKIQKDRRTAALNNKLNSILRKIRRFDEPGHHFQEKLCTNMKSVEVNIPSHKQRKGDRT